MPVDERTPPPGNPPERDRDRGPDRPPPSYDFARLDGLVDPEFARYIEIVGRTDKVIVLHPRVVKEFIFALIGHPEELKRQRNGNIMIKTIDSNQTRKLLALTDFCNMEVSVTTPAKWNASKGVISGHGLRNLSEEDIIELANEEDRIIGAQHFLRKNYQTGFSGKWFEYARTKNPYQLIEQCTHSNLTYNGNGFTHLTMGLDASGDLKSRNGATVAFTTGGNTNNPHLSMLMEDPITAAPFVILDTDYDNFACIYSCMDWNNNYLSDFGFIWSRGSEMEPAQYDQCKKAFAKHAVDTNRFNRVEHGPKCDYDLIKSQFMPQIHAAKTEL